MKVKHVMNCSFSSWYPLFRKNTIKSIILPLPDSFVQYLLADGLVLPVSNDEEENTAIRGSNDLDSEVDWHVEESDEAQVPSFPQYQKEIKKAIEELGGCCFPKLNWSSPQDARWIALNNSMCCRTVSDICLLLKSSDFIMHDLTEPFKFCTDEKFWTDKEELCKSPDVFKVPYTLILRKWMEIDPSTEFRCFVRDNKIIGISQRDYSNFYYYIGDEKNDIIQDIMSFFVEHIQNKFIDNDYTFDVYRKKKDVVRLVDFNPYGEISDPLLFEWIELETAPVVDANFQNPEFRYITCNMGIQPSPYSVYSRPRDIVDLTTGEDPHKLVDLFKLKIDSERNQSSPSDDEDD